MALIEKYPVNCDILASRPEGCDGRLQNWLHHQTFEDSANPVYLLVSIYHLRGGCSQTHLNHLNIHVRYPVKGYWHAACTQSGTSDVLIISLDDQRLKAQLQAVTRLIIASWITRNDLKLLSTGWESLGVFKLGPWGGDTVMK